MVKELYQIRTREISLNITNGEIDSVRRKNLTKSGCRVYDGEYIGVAGVLGEPTQETWAKAQRALSAKIPYPYAPAKDIQRSRVCGTLPNEAGFIAQAEAALATLKQEFPAYVFSNKINATEETILLQNDLGAQLEDTQCQIDIAILVKDEASANVFDTFIGMDCRAFDTEEVLAAAREILTAHSKHVPLPAQTLPVLLGVGFVESQFENFLDLLKLRKNASLLSGREGEKIFSDRFSIHAQRDEEAYLPFFDTEGTILEGDCLPLIDCGVLLRGLADKHSAAEYNAVLTACAGGSYDDVPSHSDGKNASISVVGNAPLDTLLDGGDAIWFATASGGDITPEGDFATPVQTAYLYHNGKLTARLPEFSFRGNLFDLCGKGYHGCSTDRIVGCERVLVLDGTISQ